MAEQTLNEPLHGDEVIEAIVDRLRTKLRMDCFLNANSSYDYFTADITIALTLHDQGVDVPTTAEVTVLHGQEPGSEVQVEDVVAAMDIAPQPPNVVREETGQPIPIRSVNEKGKTEIKRVTYSRPVKTAAKRTGGKAGGALLLLLCLAPFARSQARPTAGPPPVPVPAAPTGNPTALYDTEKIALEAVVREQRSLRAQVDENNAKAKALQMDSEHFHPGYRLNLATGTLDKVSPPLPPPKPITPQK